MTTSDTTTTDRYLLSSTKYHLARYWQPNGVVVSKCQRVTLDHQFLCDRPTKVFKPCQWCFA